MEQINTQKFIEALEAEQVEVAVFPAKTLPLSLAKAGEDEAVVLAHGQVQYALSGASRPRPDSVDTLAEWSEIPADYVSHLRGRKSHALLLTNILAGVGADAAPYRFALDKASKQAFLARDEGALVPHAELFRLALGCVESFGFILVSARHTPDETVVVLVHPEESRQYPDHPKVQAALALTYGWGPDHGAMFRVHHGVVLEGHDRLVSAPLVGSRKLKGLRAANAAYELCVSGYPGATQENTPAHLEAFTTYVTAAAQFGFLGHADQVLGAAAGNRFVSGEDALFRALSTCEKPQPGSEGLVSLKSHLGLAFALAPQGYRVVNDLYSTLQFPADRWAKLVAKCAGKPKALIAAAGEADE